MDHRSGPPLYRHDPSQVKCHTHHYQSIIQPHDHHHQQQQYHHYMNHESLSHSITPPQTIKHLHLSVWELFLENDRLDSTRK